VDRVSLRIAYDVYGAVVFHEAGSFGEASNFAAGQEIFHILWIQNGHYRVHKIHHFPDAKSDEFISALPKPFI
jgi:hypothetical protein